jgi:TPR repeat protein
MNRSPRLILALLAVGTGSILAAAVPRTPLTPPEAQRLAASARACTGGYYRIAGLDKPTIRRSAADHLPALPAAGDDGSTWSEERADDAYALAVAMLENSITFSEKALSASSRLDCPQDVESGVRLFRFLAGDDSTSWLGASNVHHWLAEAYRAGIGVRADPARARRHFLIARVSGHDQLGPSAWGEGPGDTLASRYARPADRAVFEEILATARYPDEARLVVAEIVAAADPRRARALLEAAAASNHSPAVRKLAEYEMDGTLGKPDPARAVELLARSTCRRCDTYEAMLAAARASNGGGEIPTFPRRIGIGELGGLNRLLPDPSVIERDSLVGSVEARGLMAPDGRILFVELVGTGSRFDSLTSATLTLFQPKLMSPLTPHRVGGRPVFAWVDLPRITWGWDDEKHAPRSLPEAVPD